MPIDEEQKYAWVFNASRSVFPGGLFEDLELAEEWILRNKLTGVLTKYPIGTGTYDYAIKNGLVNIEDERVDSVYIGNFSCAGFEHYHYEDGIRD